MKTYRVTILHHCNNHHHISAVSVTVPAVAGDLAIDTTIRSNNLEGKVVSAKAEEVN